MTTRPAVGKIFEPVTLPRVGGGEVVLGGDGRWQLIVIYRGKHCPICKTYLSGFEELKAGYEEAGIEVCAISADPQEKADVDVEEMGLSLPVGYDLTEENMRQMGLYISDPVSPKEHDRRFPEPGVLVINPLGRLHVADIGSAPFVRTDLKLLLGGLKYVIGSDYPVRGTA